MVVDPGGTTTLVVVVVIVVLVVVLVVVGGGGGPVVDTGAVVVLGIEVAGGASVVLVVVDGGAVVVDVVDVVVLVVVDVVGATVVVVAVDGVPGGAIPGGDPDAEVENAHPSTEPTSGVRFPAPALLKIHEPPGAARQYAQNASAGGVCEQSCPAGRPSMRHTKPGNGPTSV
jgi:hypothetical protein